MNCWTGGEIPFQRVGGLYPPCPMPGISFLNPAHQNRAILEPTHFQQMFTFGDRMPVPVLSDITQGREQTLTNWMPHPGLDGVWSEPMYDHPRLRNDIYHRQRVLNPGSFNIFDSNNVGMRYEVAGNQELGNCDVLCQEPGNLYHIVVQ
ncbi:hypothetical protein ACF0H5_009267 [Mactra antiquata]